MALLSYRLDQAVSPNARSTTDALDGLLKVIVKNDGQEAPAQVYSELVANRLSLFLGIPVALGVAARFKGDAQVGRFASLCAHDDDFVDFTADPSDGDSPGDAWSEKHFKVLCDKYPIETSFLAVFDVWIGNCDRAYNLKARMDKDSPGLLFAIDHGSSLLSCSASIPKSMTRLESGDFPKSHIFTGLVDPVQCGVMVERIQNLPEWAMQNAIVCDEAVGSVLPTDQYVLLELLIDRKRKLTKLVERVLISPGGGE